MLKSHKLDQSKILTLSGGSDFLEKELSKYKQQTMVFVFEDFPIKEVADFLFEVMESGDDFSCKIKLHFRLHQLDMV